jgi:hypothetical protein
MNVAESSTISIPPGNGVQQLRDDEYRRRILTVQGKSMQYFPFLLIFSEMEQKNNIEKGLRLFRCSNVHK